jgi:hypothetical protein
VLVNLIRGRARHSVRARYNRSNSSIRHTFTFFHAQREHSSFDGHHDAGRN